MTPTLHEIFQARRRIGAAARVTPVERSDWLSDLAGVPIHLKLECWQRARSFKIRGAYNAISRLAPESRERGLVAASAGNHGQGVALAAREWGASTVIFVPADAPTTKKERIRAFGAELREIEGIYDDAEAAALEFARTSGRTFVHPFADRDVVAGQGTIGLELLDQVPTAREYVVPVGGGGLIAGIGLVIRAAGPAGARILGVQSERTRSMYDAFEAGAPIESEFGPTLADGLAGGVEPVSYERARAVADEVLLVSEDEIAEAVRQLYRRDGIVAEGAGATPVALLCSGRWRPAAPAVLVISGGNIDPGRLARLLGND